MQLLTLIVLKNLKKKKIKRNGSYWRANHFSRTLSLCASLAHMQSRDGNFSSQFTSAARNRNKLNEDVSSRSDFYIRC